MLKKLSVILLVVASWLILIASPTQAASLANILSPPGTMPHPTPTPKYVAPLSLSLLTPKSLNEELFSENSFRNGHFSITSYPTLLLFFLPFYLIVFTLNCIIECEVGSTFRFSQQKRFPLIILLMNLATHPFLTMALITIPTPYNFAGNYLAIGTIELLIVLIEALIFGWWYNRNKPKNTPHFTLAQALGFSLAINLVSFLLGEIISLTAPLLTLVNPLLNHYMLSIIILAFIALYAWIFQPLHLKTHKYQLNREI